jgi:energy-converting hydrogenase Eha subunit G
VAAFLSILSSLLVGIALVVAPWSPLWEANWLLQMWPAARGIVLSGFTRGAVSGLGLVNLVLALRDVHARLTGGSWGGPDAG